MNHSTVVAEVANIISKTTDPGIVLLLQECALRPVHPIFHRSRWLNLSDTHYVLIAPSLVVATYMLTCPQTTLFLHTILFSPRQVTSILNTHPRRPLTLPLNRVARGRTPTGTLLPLSSAATLQVEEALHQLTTFLTLTISTEPDTRPQPVQAFCRPGAAIDPNVPGGGEESNIYLSEKVCSEIDPRTCSRIDLLVTWFYIAKCLCHELCHALNLARFGRSGCEPIFEDQRFNELGNAFEAFTFGGSYSYVVPSVRSNGLVPAPEGAIRTKEGVLILIVPADSDIITPTRSVWYVGEDWLSSLFTDAFWTKRPWPEVDGLVPQTVFFKTMSIDDFVVI